jgi:threonyl-tRNA synthetase
MRMLIWHVDAFAAEPTERGRSKLADETPPTVRVEEALVVFAASEKADEPEPEAVAERAVAAVIDVARRLGEQTVVLHSFAHLFVELSTPATAKAILDKMQSALEAQGYSVQQSAFGWFNRLEMRAKGHPLSRVARQV